MNRIDDIQFVPLQQEGLFAIVDYEDRDRVLPFKWYLRNGYPSVQDRSRDAERSYFAMHDLVLGLPKRGISTRLVTDHANGNRLDNRKGNLRRADRSQNAANSGLSIRNRSGFKGVSWRERGQCWQATIRVRGRNIYLGRFRDPEDAAAVYDASAREHFGHFAFQNLAASAEAVAS